MGGDVHEFPQGLFSSERGAMIDSGTTLAYLPNDIYDMTLKKVKWYKPCIIKKEGIWICHCKI